MIKCIFCDRNVHDRYISQHIQYEHPEEYQNMRDKVIALFDDLSIDNKTNLSQYGVYLSYEKCKDIWRERYGQEKLLARARKIAAIKRAPTQKTANKETECPVCYQKVKHMLQHIKGHPEFYEEQKHKINKLFFDKEFKKSTLKNYHDIALTNYDNITAIWRECFGKMQTSKRQHWQLSKIETFEDFYMQVK